MQDELLTGFSSLYWWNCTSHSLFKRGFLLLVTKNLHSNFEDQHQWNELMSAAEVFEPLTMVTAFDLHTLNCSFHLRICRCYSYCSCLLQLLLCTLQLPPQQTKSRPSCASNCTVYWSLSTSRWRHVDLLAFVLSVFCEAKIRYPWILTEKSSNAHFRCNMGHLRHLMKTVSAAREAK